MRIYSSLLPPLSEYLDGTRKTLGFGVLNWCSRWLVQPDGLHQGEPWVFKADQAHFILAFYEVDAKGKWVYNRAYRERAKGTGKSPMVAAMACAEFLGPVRFSHWDADGKPVGRHCPDPNIWLAATSLDGSNHTYRYIIEMLSAKAEYEYDLDIGLGHIKVNGHPARRLQQITASPNSIRGSRPSFVIMEETQDWTPSEGGDKLNEAIRLGLGKTGGRHVEVTNAPEPGSNSVAEVTHRHQQKIEDGEARYANLLFDVFVVECDDIYDEEECMAALQIVYEHAPWQDLDRIWQEINDGGMSETTLRRMYFNQFVEPKSLWLSAVAWNKTKHERLRLNKRDRIAIGFRYRRQCVAVVATRLKDSAVFPLKIWEHKDTERTPREFEVDPGEIDRYVRRLFDTHNVVYCMANPNGFQEVVGRWVADYSEDIVFEALWMDRNKVKHAEAVDAFESSVRQQRLKQAGDPTLERHIENCFTTEVPQGTLIRMETLHSKKFIVAAEAALLSFQGMIEALEDGLDGDAPDNEIFGIG